MMYMPWRLPSRIAFMISTTVKPGLSSRAVCHSASNRFADGVVVDPLIVGKDHRNQTRVRRTLHVVLAAQRMQAGPRPADLTGHQGQGDQTPGVIGAVNVL